MRWGGVRRGEESGLTLEVAGSNPAGVFFFFFFSKNIFICIS